MKTANHFFLLLFGLLIACENETKQQPAVADKPAVLSEKPLSGELSEPTKNSQSKQYNNIQYTVRLLSALDFLAQKGEQVVDADKKELSKESVLILTLDTGSPKEIFEHPQLTLEKEDAIQYLADAVSEDVSIEQNGETLHPTGASFEMGAGAAGKLRTFLHFNTIDMNQPMQIVYYDRLFGAGMMRFALNKPHI